jgi:ribose transport system permease protein
MPSRLYLALFWRRNRGVGGVALVTLVALIVYAFLFPGLLKPAGVAQLSQAWFLLAAASMSQALVMLTGGVDLATGSLVSLGAVLTATLLAPEAFGTLGGLAAVLAIGAAIGATTGTIVTLVGLPPIVVTLATSFVWTGVALLILPTPGGAVPAVLSNSFAGGQPTVLLVILALVVLWKLFQHTPTGQGVYASGGNAVGAFRSGVPVTRVTIIAYAIAGALAVLSGVAIAVQTGSGDPTIGAPYTLNSITAAVLGGVAFTGGVGTLRGTLIGALLLTVLINVMFFMGLPPFYQYVAQGLIILGAVSLPLLRRRPA